MPARKVKIAKDRGDCYARIYVIRWDDEIHITVTHEGIVIDQVTPDGELGRSLNMTWDDVEEVWQ